LLKVKMPPNAMANLTGDDADKKKMKKGKSREVTVHEFEKTTKESPDALLTLFVDK